MSTVRFRTNLDEAQPYLSRLPDYHSFLPPVGSRIEFTSFHRKATFQLEVVELVFDMKAAQWIAELHIPKTFAGQSIRQWMDWFRRHVNGEE
jgi:hypothetical protein